VKILNVRTSVLYPSTETVSSWLPGASPTTIFGAYPLNSPSTCTAAPTGIEITHRLPDDPGGSPGEVVGTDVVGEVVGTVVTTVVDVVVGTVVTWVVAAVVGDVPMTRYTLGGVTMPPTGTFTGNVTVW